MKPRFCKMITLSSHLCVWAVFNILTNLPRMTCLHLVSFPMRQLRRKTLIAGLTTSLCLLEISQQRQYNRCEELLPLSPSQVMLLFKNQQLSLKWILLHKVNSFQATTAETNSFNHSYHKLLLCKSVEPSIHNSILKLFGKTKVFDMCTLSTGF